MPTASGRVAGRLSRFVVALAAMLALLVVVPMGADAHEPRVVGDGNYTMTVGFLNEPAYLGLENGLFLTVIQIGGANAPVEDLQNTLQAEVIFGGSTMTLTLTPIEDAPGRYVSRFIPTRTGDYTFHITGMIGDKPIDQEFRSSPDTFDSIRPASAAQFPDPVPAGSDLAAAIDSATDDAESAGTLAFVGIGIGAFGTLLGLFCLGVLLRRRSS